MYFQPPVQRASMHAPGEQSRSIPPCSEHSGTQTGSMSQQALSRRKLVFLHGGEQHRERLQTNESGPARSREKSVVLED